jgi:high-affinity Fe2+/Pb2+ permease
MKRLIQAAVHTTIVAFLASLSINRVYAQDAVLALTFGMSAGLMLAFVIGYVLMFFEERAARRAREVST